MTNYPANMTLRPLDGWPTPFTRARRDAPFRSKFTDTIKLLDQELRNLEPDQRHYPRSILQLALRERDFRIDGMPRVDCRPSHPGVILAIEPNGEMAPMSFPCDTFWDWKDNLRAIALGMEALRKVNRYGITQTGQQYRGWQAIEAAPTLDAKTAACVLLARIAWPNENDERQANWAPKVATDPDIGRNTYKQARAKAHPDRHNGDRALWDQVEQAAALLGLAGAG